ncbi:MAG: phage holin family protein [Roseovarius sp.]
MGARLRNAARATAFSVMGVVFGLVGLGLLTVALWILLAAHEGVLVAYTAIGALYLLVGVFLMALGAQGNGAERPRHAPPPPEPERDPFVQLAEGFATGMQAGRAARDRRD